MFKYPVSSYSFLLVLVQQVYLSIIKYIDTVWKYSDSDLK
jgi:hypothetical protein